MLNDKHISFLKDELTKSGIVFESVQNILDTNVATIVEVCSKIIDEEGMRCLGKVWDEAVGMYIESDEAHKGYRAGRMVLAEDIYALLA